MSSFLEGHSQNNLADTSREIYRSTIEPPAVEDLYDRVNTEKPREPDSNKPSHSSQTSSIADRYCALKERISEKVQIMRERYPNTVRYAGYAAKAVGVVAKNTPVGRAATVASYVPDAWQYGKQVWHFIDEAREARAAEEKLARGKAYHEIHERLSLQEKVKTFSLETKLEHLKDSAGREKPYWSNNYGEFTKSEATQSQIGKTSSDIHRLRDSKVTLLSDLSKRADNQHFSQGLNASRNVADEYRKTFMVGSAVEKYHYLLDEVRRGLGDDYFDVVKHPQRAVKFDAFAAQRLYEDGFSKVDVEKSITQGAFYHSVKEGKAIDVNYSYFYAQYEQQTLGKISPESDVIRDKIQTWQWGQSHQVQAGKLNPHELRLHHELKAMAADYSREKSKETTTLALKELADYKAANAQSNIITTRKEYLLEAGKRIEAGRIHNDSLIVSKLIQAGHDSDRIVETLSELSPHMNGSQKASRQFLERLSSEERKNPYFQQKLQEVESFKMQSPQEKRLDRLGLSFEQTEGKMHHETFKGTTKNIMENTSRFSRELPEIEH